MTEPRLQSRRRQLSRFMCEELLYEYLQHRLDPERERAVEQTLETHADLQRELDVIKRAEDYCGRLEKIRISTLQIEALKASRSFTSRLTYRLRYRNWPDVLQWTLQAFVLSALVATAALIIPWSSLEHHIERITTPTKVSVQKAPVATKAAPPATNNVAPKINAPPTAKINKTHVAISAVPPKPMPPKLNGVLYRMWMSLPDAYSVGTKVRKKIISLGGHKAGEVQLDWHRPNPVGSYFHFVLPKKNYNSIVQALNKYGPVQIAKTANVRVMPPGEVRIILVINKLPSKKKSDDQQTKPAK